MPETAREVREVMKGIGNEVISTQIRLPADIHKYIRQEADKMGIAQNAFLIMLLYQGKRMWEADIIHQVEAK